MGDLTRNDLTKNGLVGMVLDEQAVLSLADLCRICAIEQQMVVAMIDEGLIEPQGESDDQWCFSAAELRRVKVAIRLQQDLRVNLPGAALIVDLLEELEELRRR